MTFSIAARCARTGQFGAAVATSALAVGSRVQTLGAKTGVVLVQFWSDPHLGRRGLKLLESGCTAGETVAAMTASTAFAAWRQIAVVDPQGQTASYSGTHVRAHIGERHGRDCVAVGNILSNDDVLPAALDAFLTAEKDDLCGRLLVFLSAALAAGGEPVPLRSAAVQIVEELDFPLVDLRVDRSERPIDDLGALWHEFKPKMRDYVTRVTAPQTLA